MRDRRLGHLQVRGGQGGLQSRYSARLIYLQLSLVAMIWGGTFVAGRYMSVDTPALLSASLRFLLAGAVLGVFLLLSKQAFVKLSGAQLVKVLGLGFCGIYAYNLCFFYGLHLISASRASLIVALNPAVMAIGAYLMYREAISVVKAFGIVLCLVGAAVVIFAKNHLAIAGDGADWRGDLLIFGCVLSWVAYSLLGKSVVKEIGALHTVTYSIWAGAAMLIVTAIAKGQFSLDLMRALPANELLSLTYLGAIGSALAYIWFYNGIQVIGATRAGVFIALNPLTAVLLGWGLLDEHISPYTAVGGALVIGGIVLCNKPVSASRSTWFRSGFVCSALKRPYTVAAAARLRWPPGTLEVSSVVEGQRSLRQRLRC